MPVFIEEVTKKRYWRPLNNLNDLEKLAKTSKSAFFAYKFNQLLVHAYARTFMVDDYKSIAFREQIKDNDLCKTTKLYSTNKKKKFNDFVQQRWLECIDKKDKEAAIRGPLYVACNIMAQNIFNAILTVYGPRAFWRNFDLSESFKLTFFDYYASFLRNQNRFDFIETMNSMFSKIQKDVNNFTNVEYDVWNICLDMWYYHRRIFYLHWCNPNFEPRPQGEDVPLKFSMTIDSTFFNDVCHELGANYILSKQKYEFGTSRIWYLPKKMSTRETWAYMRAVYDQVQIIEQSKNWNEKIDKLNSLFEKTKTQTNVVVLAKPLPNANPFLVCLE